MSIQVIELDECYSARTQGFRRIHIFNACDTNNNISLEYVILATGAESIPHAHLNTHTVVFTIKGGVKIYYGDQLEHQVKVGPNESVYIPPNIIHHVVNEHEEDMIAVVARTPSKNKVKESPGLLKLIQSII